MRDRSSARMRSWRSWSRSRPIRITDGAATSTMPLTMAMPKTRATIAWGKLTWVAVNARNPPMATTRPATTRTSADVPPSSERVQAMSTPLSTKPTGQITVANTELVNGRRATTRPVVIMATAARRWDGVAAFGCG